MPVITDIALPFAEGVPLRDRALERIKQLPPNDIPNTLRVALIREPFDDYYLVYLEDGSSEELEENDVRAWLAERGANEELIQKSVDQAWNFYTCIILIKNPKKPNKPVNPLMPL